MAATQFDVVTSPKDGLPVAEELRIEFTLGPLDLQVKDAKHKKAYETVFKLVKKKAREKIEGVLNQKVAENTGQLQQSINEQLRLQSLALSQQELQDRTKAAVANAVGGGPPELERCALRQPCAATAAECPSAAAGRWPACVMEPSALCCRCLARPADRRRPRLPRSGVRPGCLPRTGAPAAAADRCQH